MKQIYCSHSFLQLSGKHKIRFITQITFLLLISLCSVSSLTGQVRIVGMSDNDAGAIYSMDSSSAAVQTWINLNEFNLPSSPRGTLVGANGKFWGVARNGGQFGKGCLFNMNPDGSGLQVLYSFGSDDGLSPEAGLILHEGKLWGTTPLGGVNNFGVIYNWNITTGTYTKVHDFDGTQGANPRSPLEVIGNKLWGNTNAGGTNNLGTIFTINDDENGFTMVHSFSGGDGQNPINVNLIEINGKVWGSTDQGGDLSPGVIFSIDTTTMAFTKEYEFDASGDDEWWEPYGSLTFSNGKIWGTARGGGANGYGVIFNINPDGSGLTEIHDFVISNGEEANGGLIEAEGKLWGMTQEGGEFGDGIVFSIDTSGTNFTKVLDLSGSSFGRFSSNTLAVLDDRVYGMTQIAGLYNQGTIFKVNPLNNQSELVKALNRNSLAYDFDSSLVDAYGKLWGISKEGGPSNAGNIFSIDRDGANFTVVHNFELSEGPNSPLGSLTAAFGRLWGVTELGGTYDGGVLFSLDAQGGDFTVHHEFGQFPDGVTPNYDLLVRNGQIFGTTSEGGANLAGTIFRVNADGAGYIQLAAFDFDNGAFPTGGLIEVNGKLWGVTEEGGVDENGNIFTINYDGSELTTVYEFQDTGDGFFPRPTLVAYGDKVYGSTQGSELSTATGQSLFSVNADGTGFQLVQELTANSTTTGFGTRGRLLAAEGKLWGVNSYGGVNGHGTIFSIDTATQAVAVAHSFDNAIDAELPLGGLTLYAGKLWGQTQKGGGNSRGIVFSIATDGSDFQKERDVSFDGFGGDPANIPLLVLKNLAAIQVDTASYTYGDPGFVFSVLSDEDRSYDFASSETDVLILDGDSAIITGAGTTVVSTFHSETETYKADSLKETITIAKAPLTISAGDLTRPYNEENPEFTFAYEGFVYDEDSTVLNASPLGSTSATIDSDVGTYAITVSGASSDNYNISYTGGFLTIVQANQTITFDSLENRIIGQSDATFTLSATTTSGLDITYQSSNDSVISINGNEVTVLAAGTAEITASQAGNSNYLAADDVVRTLVVEESTTTSLEEDVLDISGAIYPNPVTRQFQINTDFNFTDVTLYDIEGRVVKRFGKQNEYFVGNLTAGTYLIELRNSQQLKRGRLIVR
ncbi:MAG: choice-of-anchor tandem repeat GloVer-containing protein [Bacteroidota bacterium]